MSPLCSRENGADIKQDMLASYKDVKERPCQQCGKLLDNRARFPVVRRRKRTKNDAGEFESTWEAVHESCS